MSLPGRSTPAAVPRRFKFCNEMKLSVLKKQKLAAPVRGRLLSGRIDTRLAEKPREVLSFHPFLSGSALVFLRVNTVYSRASKHLQ